MPSTPSKFDPSFSKIIVINIIIIALLLCCFPQRILSENAFQSPSDGDAICAEMEKSNEESSGSRQEKAIHAHPDADDDEDDETDAQNEKYEPVLNVNSSRFVRNHLLTVNVSSEIPYKGVIIQALLASTGAKVGHFIEDAERTNQSNLWEVGHNKNSTLRALNCGNRHKYHHHSHNSSPTTTNNSKDSSSNNNNNNNKDTVVHWTDEDQLRSSSYLWVYSDEEELRGQFIYFVANICTGRSKCWRNITSALIPFDRDLVKIDISQCGKTKGCFRYPGPQIRSCDWLTCQFLLTYHVTGTEAHFEMSGKSAWIAVGFSSDNRMGGDDVFMCVRTRAGVEIRRYVTELGHVSPTLVEKHPFYNMEGSAIGLEWSSNPSNVTLTCRFSRPLKVMYDQSSVDLSATWFQLYAWGPVSSSDTILRHAVERPLTSGTKVTLKTTRNEVASHSSSLRISFTCFSFIFVAVAVVVDVVVAADGS